MIGNMTLRERAYEQIYGWILSGKLSKGTVTSEVEISRLLDMSRTPVRSALQQLELEGYVRIAPKHGVLILDSSSQRVSDLLEIITSLSLFAVNRLWISQQQEVLVRYSEQKSAVFLSLVGSGEATSKALIQFEYELLRDLLDLIQNVESIRIYQNATDRLFWQLNEDRWHTPYGRSTEEQVHTLILSLAESPGAFCDALFNYLFCLKRTWV